jgi:hypothetical protein
MRNILLFILVAIMAIACNSRPKNVDIVLQQAQENRVQLESVIKHFQYEVNQEKLYATYYLIGNMSDKYSYSGDAVTDYDSIFRILDSLYHKKVKMLTESPVLKLKWDSLTNEYGMPNQLFADKISDSKNIKANLLIECIDVSYKVWKTNRFNKDISFPQYCEYLLPYRISNERLDPWMKYLNAEFKYFRDTVNANSNFQLAKKMDALLRKRIGLNHTIDKYPFDMTAKQMEMARRGACKHLVNYEAMVMRSNGIPVSLDFALHWGDIDKGHEWLALIDGKQKPFAFNAAQEEFEGFNKVTYRFAKVYRKSFAAQNTDHPADDTDIPSNLFDNHRLDVTAEYTRTADLMVPLPYPSLFNNKHAIICTYGKQWVPQSWGYIKNGTVEFRNIGTNLVYMAMYYHDKKLFPAAPPFIVDVNGKIESIKPSTQKEDLVLLRKAPWITQAYRNVRCFLNGRFQGANKSDFSDSRDLFTIHEIPTQFVDIVLKKPELFRFARYIPAAKQKTNLAELEFYKTNTKGDTVQVSGTIKGRPEISPDLGTPYQNAFDHQPDTYFSGEKDSISWAGLDMGKPTRIVKIRYCPRSDSNFILIGDIYELFLWQKDHWASLGKQIAKSQRLIYKGIPAKGLYLLHDCSRGKEERIFTYQHGKQVWW